VPERLAVMLGSLRDPRAVPPLIAALADAESIAPAIGGRPLPGTTRPRVDQAMRGGERSNPQPGGCIAAISITPPDKLTVVLPDIWYRTHPRVVRKRVAWVEGGLSPAHNLGHSADCAPSGGRSSTLNPIPQPMP